MHVVFGKEAEAVDCIARIDAALGYPNAETMTETWGEVTVHPNGKSWAVIVDERIADACPDDWKAAVERSADWDPQPKR